VQSAGGLKLNQCSADQVKVQTHPVLDLASSGRRQRADFIAEVGDSALTVGRDPGMPQQDLAEAFFRVANREHRQHDIVPDALETVGDDLEEQRLFAVEVVIQAGLGQPQRPGDVADRRRIVAAVAKDLRGRPANLYAARFNRLSESPNSCHGTRSITKEPGCQELRCMLPTVR
jgi:hypothetical protein